MKFLQLFTCCCAWLEFQEVSGWSEVFGLSVCVCKLRGNLILVFLKGSWTSGSVYMCVCVCDAIDIPFHQCFGYGCRLHACMRVCVYVCVQPFAIVESSCVCFMCLFMCVWRVCVFFSLSRCGQYVLLFFQVLIFAAVAGLTSISLHLEPITALIIQ